MGIVNATLLVKSEVFSVKLRKSLQVLERSAHGCQTSVKLEETTCSSDFSKLFLHHLTTGSAPTLFCDLVAAMKITCSSTYYKVVTHEEGGKLGEKGEKSKRLIEFNWNTDWKKTNRRL